MYVALAYAGLTCCLLGRMLAQSSPFQICLLAQLSIWQEENKTKLWTRVSLYWCFKLFWYDSILDDQHINLPCPSVFIYCKYHNRTYNYSTVVLLREREREKKNMEHSAQHTPSPPPPPPAKKKQQSSESSKSTLLLHLKRPRCCPMSRTCGRASNSETVRTASLKWPQLLGPLGWPVGWQVAPENRMRYVPPKTTESICKCEKNCLSFEREDNKKHWSCW